MAMTLVVASKYEALSVSGLGLDMHDLGLDLDTVGLVNITDSRSHW